MNDDVKIDAIVNPEKCHEFKYVIFLQIYNSGTAAVARLISYTVYSTSLVDYIVEILAIFAQHIAVAVAVARHIGKTLELLRHDIYDTVKITV